MRKAIEMSMKEEEDRKDLEEKEAHKEHIARQESLKLAEELIERVGINEKIS